MERSLSLRPPFQWPRILTGVGIRQVLGLAVTVLVALLVFGPLAFLGWKGFQAGLEGLPATMVQLDILRLLGRVGLLALVTTGLALLWAVPLAWLTVRTDLPGRHIIHWLAPLPLAVPPYVGALVYQMLLVPGGMVSRLAGWWTGGPARPLPVVNIYSLLGAAWVLSLFTYPYIYLLVRSALEKANPALEEVAQAAGLGPLAVARRVILPMVRPALTAGCLLVFLYSWADFGVVSLLRVRTLTTVIYDIIQGTMDWGVPAALSVVLTAITVAVLLTQRSFLGRARYSQTSNGGRPPRLVSLGRARWPALAYVAMVLGSALFLPIGLLTLQASGLGARELASVIASEASVVANSLWLATAGATMALALALVVAWYQERRRHGFGASGLLQVGYAVPGTVLGLGMVGFYHAWLPWLYGSSLVVAVGYVCLFATPALQTVRAALQQIPPALEEAAQGLGRGPVRTFRAVTMPLLRSGLLGGWVLVFILSMRELAATLVLRPPGVDTLPVRIWTYTVDVGPEPRAAALALLLVGLIAVPWLLFLLKRPAGFALNGRGA